MKNGKEVVLLDVLVSNVIAYEVWAGGGIFFYASLAYVGDSVNVKLLVADPANVSTTSTLPLGSDQEAQVIQEVMQILGVVPRVTDEAANANNQI